MEKYIIKQTSIKILNQTENSLVFLVSSLSELGHAKLECKFKNENKFSLRYLEEDNTTLYGRFPINIEDDIRTFIYETILNVAS